MITATLERRVKVLEDELASIKTLVRGDVYPTYTKSIKKLPTKIATKTTKLPKWLQASLKDVEEGRVSGPFDTVEELMAHLEK